jgi:bifunctional UDP-N-acetylglucosamine pyrophosphorylase/glucosamine-1-phosphate N-acetyltransferase
MSQPVSAVILAAGLGTRMKSKLAKVLHRAGGLSLIEHVVRAAQAVAPADRIAAVIGHQAEQVRACVEGSGIHFRLQAEQKGTGHAVLMCDDVSAFHEGRLLILYGDCPLLSGRTLERLLSHHEASGAAASVITTHLTDPTGYGRVVRDGRGRIAAIVEQKAATEEQKRITEINSGIYCIEAAAFWQHLRALRPNPASGEIYLTDVVESLNAAGQSVSPFVLEDASELLGINTKVELAEVDRIFRRRKATELMLAGVTILQPETVLIDADVTVGADTVIGPYAQLLGATTVGEDCEVGACSILRDASLETGARVLPFCSVEESRVGAGSQVGPFARLRLHAELSENTRVGNFVELKKAKLGPGAKANHLAYLGDASIGAKSNIGAGTITCNYDGAHKHQTTIGEGAFIGSNSTLVAPLKVESGAYVAAGSVITDPVPEDALALGRARQVVKPGWAKQRRASLKK